MAVSIPLDRRPGDAGSAATIREIARSVRELLQSPLITALIRPPLDVTFTGAATVRVAHGLGYPPRGYLVVRLSAPATICDGTFVTGDDPNSVFYLRSTAATTASVIFY